MEKFEHFISLGLNCATALSMKRFGLRSCSSPFDWCKCFFTGVLKTLDNDFSEFLLDENIEFTSQLNFEDKKYHLYFFHEGIEDVSNEIEQVREKYQKRIERFRENIKQKTCFIRTVWSQNEYDYILKFHKRVNRIIKKSNQENEIIFLLPNYVKTQDDFPFKTFKNNLNHYKWTNEKELSRLFEYDENLVNFLINSYDNTKRLNNLHFANKNETQNNKYRLLVNVLKTDYSKFTFPKKVAIYGIGYIGEAFYDRIKNLTNITCFIDSKSTKKDYLGIEILKLKNINEVDIDEIIVTPVFEFSKIQKRLKAKLEKNIQIKSLNDYLNFDELA